MTRVSEQECRKKQEFRKENKLKMWGQPPSAVLGPKGRFSRKKPDIRLHSFFRAAHCRRSAIAPPNSRYRNSNPLSSNFFGNTRALANIPSSANSPNANFAANAGTA